MSDLTSGFPKNLSYSIKELNGFSKQTVKILSDQLGTDVSAGQIIRFKLPPNSLIDMRTFSVFFDLTSGISGGTTGVEVHSPRYTASFIEQLNIYVNNTQVSTIPYYNQLYNALADMSWGTDTTSKRFLENYDPSVIYTYAAGSGTTLETATGTVHYPIKAYKACVAANAGHDGAGSNGYRQFAINNWVGILNNSSTAVWDTSDLGDVIVEIRLAPANIMFGSPPTSAYAAGATVTADTNLVGVPSYTLKNIRATMSRISFNSSEYYDLKAAKLLESSLLIGFQDFYGVKGTVQAKSANVSWNYNVNANSLDYILATVNRSDYNTFDYLQLYGSANGTTVENYDVGGTTAGVKGYTFAEALAKQSDATTSATIITGYTYNKKDGDLFNQVRYFQRKASGIKTAQFAINSVMVDPYPKPPAEIYNEALISLGNKNIDITSTIHPGCLSLYHFCKYYFVHICSLQNLSGDSTFWRSGLNGNAASINVQYNAVFDGVQTDIIQPLFFNAITRILSVSAGRIINVV